MIKLASPLKDQELAGNAHATLAYNAVRFRYLRRQTPIVDGFSWLVPPGKTVLLGPNGAGKSTLMMLGADALSPERGRISLGELHATRRRDRGAFRGTVGWMPQHIYAVPGLTAHEQVAYASWLKGLSRGDAWEAAAAALNDVGLLGQADERTSRLSGGQLRRVGLAQLLVHKAKVLLLDEPTVGLDPAQRARFRAILDAVPDDRRIVISTHQVDDLSEVFDTVTVMSEGKIRFEGPVEAFMALAPDSAGPRQGEAAYAHIVAGD